MKISSDFLNEEIPQILRRVHNSSSLGFIPYSIAEAFLVFLSTGHILSLDANCDCYWSAEICNVSSGEQIIDEDKETFVDDLVVCHEECNGHAFRPSLGIERQEILLKVSNAICRCH